MSAESSQQRVISDRNPFPLRRAVLAVALSVVRSGPLIVRHRVRQPTKHVGDVLHFGDGSSAPVYRETVVRDAADNEPCALVVAFRLRWIRGAGHTLFRAESILNTPLFVGFPGLVSKLWLANDENGSYRGVYEWNTPDLADAYARSLCWILRIVCPGQSIHYVVVPGCTRDKLLAGDTSHGHWWSVTGVAA